MTDAAVLASEAQKSGPIGLAIILVLCIACYFLFKSMSKHMRKVRDEWPKDKPVDPPPDRPQRPTRPVTRPEPIKRTPAGGDDPPET